MGSSSTEMEDSIDVSIDSVYRVLVVVTTPSEVLVFHAWSFLIPWLDIGDGSVLFNLTGHCLILGRY